MALCLVAPILANGVRAFGTIYAAHLTSVEAATGFDHLIYGWFFFAFVMLSVMGVSWKFFDRGINDKWLDCIPTRIGKPRSVSLMGGAVFGVLLLPLLWNGTVIASGRHPLPYAVALPEVPGSLEPRMDMASIVAMQRGERAPQGVRIWGNEDHMHVVGHQHPSPDLDAGRARVLGQKIAIEPIVFVAEKRARPPVAALGDVVRDSRKHRAGKTGHEGL